MVYNDEKLNPDNYEKMAKAYSSSIKKNIKIFTYKQDDKEKDEIIENISICKCVIENNLIQLSHYTKQQQRVKKLCLYFERYKENIQEICKTYKNNITTTNYCNNLNEVIQNCCISIKNLIKLSFYQTNIDTNLAIENLVHLIENTTIMFGVCKYRK